MSPDVYDILSPHVAVSMVGHGPASFEMVLLARVFLAEHRGSGSDAPAPTRGDAPAPTRGYIHPTPGPWGSCPPFEKEPVPQHLPGAKWDKEKMRKYIDHVIRSGWFKFGCIAWLESQGVMSNDTHPSSSAGGLSEEELLELRTLAASFELWKGQFKKQLMKELGEEFQSRFQRGIQEEWERRRTEQVRKKAEAQNMKKQHLVQKQKEAEAKQKEAEARQKQKQQQRQKRQRSPSPLLDGAAGLLQLEERANVRETDVQMAMAVRSDGTQGDMEDTQVEISD